MQTRPIVKSIPFSSLAWIFALWMLQLTGCSELQTASVDAKIAATSAKINKTLPMQLDAETRLDTTVAGGNRSLIYRYTLINREAKDLNVAELIAAIKPVVTNNYKTHKDMQDLRENNVILKYQYSDKNGVNITEIIVDPAEFK